MVTVAHPARVDAAASAADEQLSVHNPMGFPPSVTGKSLAPRLDTLNGKRVFLVDCHFDDSGLLLEQVHAWFREHMPRVHVELDLQGGSVLGSSYMGSQGNLYSFTNVTFAENEERSPWEPFHVEQGFPALTSTVSVFGSVWHTGFTLGLRDSWRPALQRMLLGMDPLCKPLFVLDPIAARQFVERGGFYTKAALAAWAAEVARIPAREYWDYQLIQNYVYPRAAFGEEPYASMLKAPPDELIPMFSSDSIHTVVVGGETNGYWRLFSGSHMQTVSVDAWR